MPVLRLRRHRSQRMLTVIRRYVQQLTADKESARREAAARAGGVALGGTDGGAIPPTGAPPVPLVKAGSSANLLGAPAAHPAGVPASASPSLKARPPPEDTTLVMIQVLKELVRPPTTSHDLPRPPTTSDDLPPPPTTSRDLRRSPVTSDDLRRSPTASHELARPEPNPQCAVLHLRRPRRHASSWEPSTSQT